MNVVPAFLKAHETRIVGISLCFFVVAFLGGLFDGLEDKTIDWRFRFRGTEDVSSPVAVVVISDECLDQIGKWPWSRSVHAEVIDRLASAGARVIAYDVIFTDPSEADLDGDRRLVEACRRAGNVIFPMYSAELKVFDPNTSLMETMTEVFRPFPYLASSALDLGLINVDFSRLNTDGIVRRVFLSDAVGGHVLLSLPAAIARHALGGDCSRSPEGRLRLGTTEVPQHPVYLWPGKKNDMTSRRSMSFLVNYLGATTSGVFPAVYFSDVLSGAIDTRVFKDKLVLIGPSAVGLGDIKLTPFGEMPGVMIHANITHNLIQGNFLRQIGTGGGVLILIALAAGIMIILRLTSLGAGVVWTLCFLVAYNLLGMTLFLRQKLVVGMVVPSMLIVITFLIGRFWQMVWSLRETYQSLKERTLELESTNTVLDNRLRELTIINQAGASFPCILDLELLAREILKFFQDLWQADSLVLYMFDPESDGFRPVERVGLEHQDGEMLLYDPEVAKHTRTMIEDRRMILDGGGKWFSAYLPLLVGSRLWGGIFLKERNHNPTRLIQEQFWNTLLGVACTALENANLYHLATVDSLTKLYVRRFFSFQLDKELKRSRRYGSAVSLLITDIDHFKKFNDTYGHQQGDTVLRETAAAVKLSLRDVDIAARYGGEEFAVILPQTNLEGAMIVAERIRICVEKMYVPRMNSEGEFLRVTLSIGVASFPETFVANSAEFIEAADTALYRAKASGRNRVEYAAPRAEEPPEPETGPDADGTAAADPAPK
jgi:diguanylate cyclase (GGDEF)-like protein